MDKEFRLKDGLHVAGNAAIVGSITTVDSVQFNLTHNVTNQIGMLDWALDDSTMELGLTPNVTLQVGQEQLYLVKNQSGADIPYGTAVMSVGTVGNSGRILVAPAIANGSVASKRVLGVTTERIVNGEDGFVSYFGKLRGLDTSIWSEGDILYVSPTTPGALSNTQPVAPNNKVTIAYVITKGINNGAIFVRPTFGSAINEDENVHIDSILDGQMLIWNNTTGRFENKTYTGYQANDYNTYTTLSANDYNTYSTLAANDGATLLSARANDFSTWSGLNTYVNLKANTASPTFTGDVTVADKIVHDGDTNTAIRFPAVDTFTVETSGLERFRILPGGNVSIGITSGNAKLHVAGTNSGGGILVEDTSNSAASPAIEIIGKRSDTNGNPAFAGKLLLTGFRTDGSVATGKTLGVIEFGGNHSDGNPDNVAFTASIAGVSSGAYTDINTMPTDLVFYTGSVGRNPDTAGVNVGTERIRIDTNGNVGIGTATAAQKLDVVGSIRASSQLISTVVTGTAPFAVNSTTLVSNLNADLLDGAELVTIQNAYSANDYNTYSTLAANDGATLLSARANDYNTFTTLSANDYTTLLAAYSNDGATLLTARANDGSTLLTARSNDFNTYSTLAANDGATLLTARANDFSTWSGLNTYVNLKANTASPNFTGNVGINSATPGERLDVAGNVKISGGIVANNSLGTAGQVLTSNGVISYWSTPTGGSTKFTTTIGDGSANTFIITHNLNSADIFTSIRNTSTNYFVYPDIKYNNTNSITVEFSSVPTANSYYVAIIGA